ncbi:MAG: HAMP domain-containing histidine kinase [Ruminococcus sp.]|nr:HAMP domain-containing histidine kinase [Ruminococcus sp.]
MKKRRFKGLAKRAGTFRAAMSLSVFLLIAMSQIAAGAAVMFFQEILKVDLGLSPLILFLVEAGISCLIGMLLSVFIAKSLFSPVDEVIKAMKKVADGDFSIRIESDDAVGEINELINSYNRMAEELDGIELFRENFINSFSHEFKTPIVSIQGFASQLRKKDLPEEKRAEYTEIIISESKRLTNLSSNILLLTKLENQQILSDKSVVRLDEQIRDCVLLLEKQWSAKGIEFDIDMEPINFETNAEMLSQAWVNIIGNAIKFSPEDSVIRITLKRTPGGIRAEITDRGIGIREDTISHIFEKFYQGDKAHSSAGNGLGLPLVKRIIELNEGTIRVESQYGQGTKFIVVF